MKVPKKFIQATTAYNTFEQHIPAPYLRKSFQAERDTEAQIVVAACGFYELYVNGLRYTKGFLAPYISNPEDYIYCDAYTVPLQKGENVIGLLLGNGFQNNPGGYIWDFDTATFRSAPMVGMAVHFTDDTGKEIHLESDETFKVAESPIRSDDYRFGEYYDANFEIPGWNLPGFDDTEWKKAKEVTPPKGELRLCEAEPIVAAEEMKPIAITQEGDSYIYDFGVNHTGVCRMQVQGRKRQKIELQHGEVLTDGQFNVANTWFVRDFWQRDKEIVHKDTYVCKGEGTEVYMPTFTYHGFRYVKVSGILPEQATEDLLTYVVLHSDLKSRGGFACSDEIANRLQEITRRSDISNFHYFPTDCPHREKNGWTADAALSCEHMLLNFTPEVSYREWMRNICKAQDDRGALPGIVPTGGWSFQWGNGPAWDSVLAYLPYYTYVYRGETETIRESADAFMAYLRYLTTRADEKGLMHIGLGDWCHVGGIPPKAPLEVTDTVMSMDIAGKMAVMFNAVGMTAQRDFAKRVAASFKQAIRTHLIDFDTMLVSGSCQTCQAMCLHYGVFEPDEQEAAFARLLEMVHDADDHFDVGVLGGRVIFHVLSAFGHSDLAYKMITRPEFPSYGYWLEQGATTLWESFDQSRYDSLNHHFWGDISAWFIKWLAGLHFNPTGTDTTQVTIRPSFVQALDYAEAHYDAPLGRIQSSWKRDGEEILLRVQIPEGMQATLVPEKDYVWTQIETGTYRITRK